MTLDRCLFISKLWIQFEEERETQSEHESELPPGVLVTDELPFSFISSRTRIMQINHR